MTEYVEQTSVSDRQEAARKAISYLSVSLDRAREVTEEIERSREADGMQPVFDARDSADDLLSHLMVHGQKQLDALRALITPPAVGEDVDVDPKDERLIRDALDERVVRGIEASLGLVALSDGTKEVAINADKLVRLVQGIARNEFRRGVQSAHETWEPEVAMRPSQEQMLRWLGVEHELDPAVGMLFIREQYIEKEIL